MDDWERRVADLWAAMDDLPEDEFLGRMEQLTGERPADDGAAVFERAGSLDSTGHSDRAVPLYRRALELGLHPSRRRQATIQLASSLRAEREARSDALDDAVDGFLALALADTGREREAVAVALGAVSRHMTRYQRSLSNYVRELVADP
jgi:hypothetical protein